MYDVIVIGSGVGGISATARLAAAGKKVLLVESGDNLGGRASSEQIEGFTVNLGAISLVRGGAVEDVFKLLDVPFDIREPSTVGMFRIKGKMIDVTRGGFGMLLGSITKQAAKIGAKFAEAREGELPEASVSTEQWLRRYTRNATVHAVFRNLCAGFFSVNASELPARAFLGLFAVRSTNARIGYCPRGTIGLWDDLAGGIERAGGEIWRNAKAVGLRVENGHVAALDIERNGRVEQVATRFAISNIGPAATVRLAGAEAFGDDYATQAEALRPASMIVVNFATQQRLVETPALITFGPTRRLSTLVELTATCPELAPAGWHQHVAYAVPIPALADFEEKAEIGHALDDLRDEFRDFASAKILSIRVMRGDWPAQRACAGFDMPQETPIPNLWHVGDAVRGLGEGGTGACAETGRKAAERALAWVTQVSG